MKCGMIWAITALTLAIAATGCQSRRFANMGKDANGHEYGVPANSIDGYAKAHGISRSEAAKRMRDELVPPSDPHVEGHAAIATVGSETRTK